MDASGGKEHPYAEMGAVALAKSELGLIRFAYGEGPPSNEEGRAWPPRVAATWYLATAILDREARKPLHFSERWGPNR